MPYFQPSRALYRSKYPLITIRFYSKTYFFVFPDPKTRELPTSLPKPAQMPRLADRAMVEYAHKIPGRLTGLRL